MPTITLPLPPSVNRLWRAGRRRVYRSRQYEAWRTEAGWTLKHQRPPRITGHVQITIAVGRPDQRKRDVMPPSMDSTCIRAIG
jgi:Holliday junction resolvase RusA-like endonuclease